MKDTLFLIIFVFISVKKNWWMRNTFLKHLKLTNHGKSDNPLLAWIDYWFYLGMLVVVIVELLRVIFLSRGQQLFCPHPAWTFPFLVFIAGQVSFLVCLLCRCLQILVPPLSIVTYFVRTTLIYMCYMCDINFYTDKDKSLNLTHLPTIRRKTCI